MFFHDMKMLERVFWLKRIKGSGNPMHEATSTSGSFVTDVIAPLKSLKVTLEPIQDLHGYDKPWSAGAGKNKFDASFMIATGITVTGNTVVGKGSAFHNAFVTDGIPNLTFAEDTRYTLSMVASTDASASASGNGLLFRFTYTDLTSSVLWLQNTSTSPTSYQITSDAGKTVSKITMSYGGTSGDNTWTLTDIQIEEGATATSWTPYSNICPISGHTECVTEVCGRNFFNGSFNAVTPFALHKAVTVCASAELNGASYGVLRTYDENQTFIASTLLSTGSGSRRYGNITLSENVRYVKFEASGGTLTDMMIETGTVMTDYEPYQGDTYTTTLGQTVYGGTLDVVSGELVVDRAYITIDPSIITACWFGQDTDRNTLGFYTAQVGMWTYPQPSLTPSDVYEEYVKGNCYNVDTPYLANILIVSGNFNRFELRLPKSVLTDISTGAKAVESAQAYLTDNPLKMCYELATPQTYQLTPQQVNSLVGQNNIILEDGVEVSEVVYMTRLVGSPMLGSPQTEDEPSEEIAEESVEESEEPEGE